MEVDKKDEGLNLNVLNNRLVLSLCLVAIIILTSFAAFGIGAFYVCHSLDGFLDSKAICHLDYYQERERMAELNLQKIYGVVNGSFHLLLMLIISYGHLNHPEYLINYLKYDLIDI